MAEDQLICSCCGQVVEGVAALLDEDNSVVTTAAGAQRFTRQEFRLVKALHQSFGITVSKERIYDRAFADATGDGPDIKIVDVVVCKVRKKIEDLGLLIVTQWGVGYRLTASDPEMARTIPQDRVYHAWAPEMDDKLRELMRRKFTLTACAQALRMPYAATERAMKRLSQEATS